MELNELEDIIAIQMKNIYKEVVHVYSDEYCKMGSSERRWKSHSMYSKPIDDVFSYYDRIICLTIRKNNSKTEIYDFLNQTINNPAIIDALNTRQIKLHINNLLDIKSGLLWEYTEQDLKRMAETNHILLTVLKCLNEMGITIFGEFK